MKKILLFLMLLILVPTTSVFATSFLADGVSESTVDLKGTKYTITNNSEDGYDLWSDDFNGYYASNPLNYTGYYIGTFDGNTDGNKGYMLELISYYLNEPIGDNLVKYDVGSSLNTGVLSISMDDDKKAGGWTLNSTDPMNNAVNFYAVKASNSFALYYVDPVASKGFWATAHLLNDGDNIPAISHLSAATTAAAPVPEPATMFLLGVGLVGLAGLRRKAVK